MFWMKHRQQEDNKFIAQQSGEIKALVPITLELADASKGIYMASKKLNNDSQTLVEMSQDVEKNISMDRQMVAQVKNEVNAISKAADEINHHAKRNEVLSNENLKQVELSKNDLSDSIKNIEALFTYFDEVAKTLEELQSYSKNIGNITRYIDEIASKTSLVSINASIEASRAGEAGRGFMVITESIKDLANQSKSFSENINVMIKSMTQCIDGLHEGAKVNRDKITGTKHSISVLEQNLENIATSIFELDKNIQSTLVSSDEIKKSVETGNETVEELMNSFSGTEQCSVDMIHAVRNQREVVGELIKINDKVKHVSQEQVHTVFDPRMEEKLIIISQKVAAYEGSRDVETLQRLCRKYLLNSINYIDNQGCFEAVANPNALGFNIFNAEPVYKEFKQSSKTVQVQPISRNLFTGAIIQYVATKHVHTKQLISIGFDLDALRKISAMTMEEVKNIA